MKRIVFIFLMIFLVPSFSEAKTVSRKGFFIDGGISFGGEVNSLKTGVGNVDLRIGGGITDKTLLYVENAFQYNFTSFVGAGVTAYSLQGKVKQFIGNHFYVTAGAGLSVGSAHLLYVFSVSQIGFGVSGGIGAEFRVGKKFRLGPEVDLYYHRIGRENFLVPLGGIRLKGYF